MKCSKYNNSNVSYIYHINHCIHTVVFVYIYSMAQKQLLENAH